MYWLMAGIVQLALKTVFRCTYYALAVVCGLIGQDFLCLHDGWSWTNGQSSHVFYTALHCTHACVYWFQARHRQHCPSNVEEVCLPLVETAHHIHRRCVWVGAGFPHPQPLELSLVFLLALGTSFAILSKMERSRAPALVEFTLRLVFLGNVEK